MSHKILSIRQLSEHVFTGEFEAKYIAQAHQAGQFVILSIDGDFGERIPLTIADSDVDKGSIRLVWQRVGKTTAQLSDMKVGDSVAGITGPLGKATEIEQFGRVVCVGGGIGCAPLLPIVRELKKAGNEVISILGARNKDILILEEEFGRLSDELIVMTDDGSYGRKGLVTEALQEVCERDVRPAHCFCIGPAIMMKFCCELTKQYELATTVSLNTIMVDGTGMCGGCRIEYDGEPKFVCVDGPEFDGHKVNFDLMMKRLNAYKQQEKEALENYKEHKCKLDEAASKIEKKQDKGNS